MGHRWNRLNEPSDMAEPQLLMTEINFHHIITFAAPGWLEQVYWVKQTNWRPQQDVVRQKEIFNGPETNGALAKR